MYCFFFFFFQAEDGIRDTSVTGVQTCALPISDEFIRLFKKNHFPVLKRQIELGHAQQVTAEAPRFHGTEDGRWDYRVTIVWKNAAAPHEAFPDAELKRLFPDQDTFRREEQRRFEILAAHWDLPVVSVDLTRPW